LGAILLVAAVFARWRLFTGRVVIATTTVAWILLVLGHYADVTAPALYGREVNLYWDLRFVPGVAGLLARGGPRWMVVAAVAITILLLALLYLVFRWALVRVFTALHEPAQRSVLRYFSAGVVVLFVVTTRFELPGVTFSPPVTATYARQ